MADTAENETVQLHGIKSSTEGTTYIPVSSMELHGRRQIFTDEEVITAENVVRVLNKALRVHQRNREEEIYLQKYLRGIQPILSRVKKYNNYVCNKVVVNIANQIVAFKTAEFAGEPIQYVSRGKNLDVPEKIEQLNSMMLSEGKQSQDMELAYRMFTYGVGYRLVQSEKALEFLSAQIGGQLYDEAPFEIYTLNTENTFIVRYNDFRKYPIMGVTYVYLDDDLVPNKVRYTVYTKDATYTIDGSVLHASKVVNAQRHNNGYIPIIEYPCNSLYMGAFEVVIDLLDAINLTQSDRLDGIEQFIQALMVFEGVDVTRDQLLKLRDLGAIKLPPAMDGRQSRVYYLNEQLDQSQTQTLVDDMYQTVLQIVGMPSQGNANTSDSSNNGAMIIKNGWWNAEARALETEGYWKRAETEFLKIALKICDDAQANFGLKVSDLEPKFGRRSYENKLIKTQSFASLISSKTPPIQAFKYSGLDSDPEAAALQYEAYAEELEAKEEAKLQAEMDRTLQSGSGAQNAAAGGSSENDTTSPANAAEGRGHPESVMAVCPICGRSFKKRVNNQRYDREECRLKAQRSASS